MDQSPETPTGPTTAGMPRWVKISLVVVAVIVLLAVAMLLVSGHGPGRHM